MGVCFALLVMDRSRLHRETNALPRTYYIPGTIHTHRVRKRAIKTAEHETVLGKSVVRSRRSVSP